MVGSSVSWSTEVTCSKQGQPQAGTKADEEANAPIVQAPGQYPWTLELPGIDMDTSMYPPWKQNLFHEARELKERGQLRSRLREAN